MKKDFCLNECRMNDTYKIPNRWIDVRTAWWLHPAKPGLFFVYFCYFHITNTAQSWLWLHDKSIDSVLGTRTRRGRMVVADESTELWRHPILFLRFEFQAHIFAIFYLNLNCDVAPHVLTTTVGLQFKIELVCLSKWSVHGFMSIGYSRNTNQGESGSI